MHSPEWQFTGTDSLKDYQNPPLTRMFVEALLCGPLFLELDGHRENDAESAFNMIRQLLVHYALKTRQIKYKINQMRVLSGLLKHLFLSCYLSQYIMKQEAETLLVCYQKFMWPTIIIRKKKSSPSYYITYGRHKIWSR